MEDQVRVINNSAPFVSEPFLDNDGLFKYRVSRYSTHLESGNIDIIELPSIFLSEADAKACAHQLNEEYKNEGNL
ncbi:MAG: hypothetical protein ACI3Z8_02485 [Paludibacteraceae bacterium]